MSQDKQAEVERRDFVRWLAETQKHRSIATPKHFEIQERWLENKELWPAAGFWSFAEIPLSYEPRSLVVSPDGNQVAVGTKAGDVCVARWEGRVWRPHCIEAMAVHTGQGEEEKVDASPGAIRGLLYLGSDVLVAGWSNGCFSIIEQPASEQPKIEVVIPPDEPGSSTDWYLGTQRISRLVPLFDPRRKDQPVPGPVALALLSRPAMCVLKKEEDGRHSVAWLNHLGPSWDRAKGDPVDAVWAGDALWILTTHGFLFRCLSDERTGMIDLRESREIRDLTPPRPGALFQRLAACEVGLSVLAGESVTLLWFDEIEEKGTESWFPVPGSLDCAVCCPYPSEDGGRVWTVVSTAKPGLRWVGWNYIWRDGAARRNRKKPWPHSATGNFATPGGESILYLAFGSQHVDGQGFDAPIYLACGTRDHKLLIASVLALETCEAELSKQIGWLLGEVRESKATKEQAQRLFRENAGLAWSCLVTKIKRDFRMEIPLDTEDLDLEAAHLFPLLGHDDLLQLSTKIVKWHGHCPDLDYELAKWVRDLLQRATELGADTAREVAEVLYERLQGAWSSAGSESDGLRLRSLANFLRKWVIHGHTYSEKRTQLYKVFEHNRQCGRKLDALAYLTRLMRKRTDVLWETTLPGESWVPPVWGLESDDAGNLFVTSLGDGSLCALDKDGNRLPWELGKDAGNGSLVLSENRLRLESADAPKFAKQYRHGPYARFLWLRQLPGGEESARSYVLVFCLKGWRHADLRREDDSKGRPPVVYALRLRAVDQGNPSAVTSVQIERISSFDSYSELFGLRFLNEELDGETLRYRLLAGTGGSWGSDKNRQLMPFIELGVEVDDTKIEIKAFSRSVRRFEKVDRYVVGRVSVAPEAANNRCWALARSTDEEGRTWVWGGFQDGSIRGYRFETDETWCEGGLGKEGPRQRGLKATGPVWRLLTFNGPDGTPMLAYGTGDGVVGAVAIRDLEANEPGATIRFLLHAQGDSPVCGLAEYKDEGNRYLLSVDQRGTVNLFDLNAVRPILAKEEGEERGYRFIFPGLRVDQFKLGHPVRALVGLQGSGELPQILVGTSEASVHRIELRYPYYSQRRRDVRKTFHSLTDTEEGGRSVLSVMPPLSDRAPAEVAEEALRWMRVLLLGDMSLMRFSLWDELRRAGEDILQSDSDANLDGDMEAYKGVLGRLVEETLRRRPFIEDLALAIWEECAKVASFIARRILKTPQAVWVDEYLKHYHELNSLCADLCNRWIGVDQSAESIVLIDSFATLFDWTALTLIASDPPGGKKAWEVRDFLVYGLIQYRLSFSDTRVILETLRVINMAISRAIVNVTAGIVGPSRTFRIRPLQDESSSESRIGFDDIMAMVGDVWERLSDSLSYSDPLTTEVTHFFSLTLLLLPDCALILGQVVSEGRLMERGNGLAELIARQAERLCEEFGLPTENVRAGLGRFTAYISSKVDEAIRGADEDVLSRATPQDNPWCYLLNQARLKPDPGPGEGELSDAHWLGEQKHFLLAIVWMADFSRPSLFGEVSDEIKAANMEDTVAWIARARVPRYRPRFYRHSYDYLLKLEAVRERVRQQASPEEGNREIQNALDTCRTCMEELQSEHLFRPQRDHFQWILDQWREKLVKLGGEAVMVLDIMDRFNRHVYRRSADALMDNVVNLAMQTAPISYLDRWGGTYFGEEVGLSLRTRILKRLESYPLIQSVFESGEYLVQNTHLAGALLTIARHYTWKLEDPSVLSTHETVRVSDIENIAKEVARRTGLSEVEYNVLEGEEREAVPGTRVVWDLIVQEWATNLVKHAFQGEAPAEKRLVLKLEVQISQAARKGILLLFSNVSYRESLEGAALQEYQENRERSERSLDDFFKPGKRGNYRRPGAGMGLFMIKQLAELERWADMQIRLRLLGIEHLDSEPPLCLEVTWRREK
ncbi:MAG TPA: hypothetical protein VH394_26155 [Thermoanaerobaculia bacterium]|nr:hypothetical protein [Thermoanaerobaculia bacterium]